MPADPTSLHEHGPDAVRAELADLGGLRGTWIRMAMRGCEGCDAWSKRRGRLRKLHADYRRRSGR